MDANVDKELKKLTEQKPPKDNHCQSETNGLDLQKINEVWKDLPLHIKQAIKALIETAKK